MERSVGAVGVLDKVTAILDVLAEAPRSLAELATVTGMPKPTLHRLCAALETHGMVVRDADDRRRLGGRIATWARAGQMDGERHLAEVSESALRQLRDATGESVQLYVMDGDQRRCVAGLESPFGLRTIVEVGAMLPLSVGSAGAVLRGESDVVRRGWAQSVEEREKGVTSVSAPIFVDGVLVAAVSVSGPIERTTRNPGRKYGEAVHQAATQISTALAAHP